MRKYWVIYKAHMQNTLAYRGAQVLWIVGSLLNIFTLAAVWLSASTSGLIGGYSKNQLITYYLFALILNWLVVWHAAHYVKEEIKDGSIGQNVLIKPISYYLQNLFHELGWHTVSPIAGLIAVGIAYLFLHTYIEINLSLSQLILLIPAIFLGGVICFSISLCLGLLAFWLTETDSLHTILWIGFFMLGGQGMPLSFYPEQIRRIVELLPFAYIFSLPLEIFSNKLTVLQSIQGIGVQFIWIILFVILYKFMWKKGTRAYQAYGG